MPSGFNPRRTISTGRDHPRRTPTLTSSREPRRTTPTGVCGQRRAARTGRRRPPLRGPWHRSRRRGTWGRQRARRARRRPRSGRPRRRRFWGGIGDDYVRGRRGADHLNSGTGNDTVIVSRPDGRSARSTALRPRPRCHPRGGQRGQLRERPGRFVVTAWP